MCLVACQPKWYVSQRALYCTFFIPWNTLAIPAWPITSPKKGGHRKHSVMYFSHPHLTTQKTVIRLTSTRALHCLFTYILLLLLLLLLCTHISIAICLPSVSPCKSYVLFCWVVLGPRHLRGRLPSLANICRWRTTSRILQVAWTCRLWL